LFWTSPYLLLPAPKVAGLLPAPQVIPPPPPPEPNAKAPIEAFTYTSPYLVELSEERRAKLFNATQILLDVAIEVARETLTDHALNTAIIVFRQAISDKPITARNPTEFSAIMDAPLLEYMVEMAHIHTKYAHIDDVDDDDA